MKNWTKWSWYWNDSLDRIEYIMLYLGSFDKTVMIRPCLYNGDLFSSKMTSLNWGRLLLCVLSGGFILWTSFFNSLVRSSLFSLVKPDVWVIMSFTDMVLFYSRYESVTWWRHQMETFSALLALCVGISPVPVEFLAQRPVTRSFDVFVDLRLNKQTVE